MPKRRKGETVQECVSRGIPIIKREHPDWTDEHVQGAAYGMCRGHTIKKKGNPGRSRKASKRRWNGLP